MCGIAGIITPDKERAARALASMVACQVHRGPDDDGHELIDLGDTVVGLGQRRLAIIDLSPAGHQPMVEPESGAALTYNGELYNFKVLRAELEAEGVRFRGHSDTEVLLHALVRWGTGCLGRLEGMFAIIFFDPRTRRLLLARDPMGIKPLYVAQRPDGLAAASEVRALLASGLVSHRVDLRGVAGLLAYGAIQEPCTFYEGIRAFPAGAWQSFDVGPGGRVAPGPVTRYWTFPTPDKSIDERTAAWRVSETFNAAVRDHLVSDVPVGVFLSSGLDSSIIAALATRDTPQLRTLTVGFDEHLVWEETKLARETAELLGVSHTEIKITNQNAERATVNWLESLDQPSVDGLNTYVISEAVRGQGIVVALSGLGGDELFGGYASFADVPRAKRIMDRLAWMPPSARAGLLSAGMALRGRHVRDKAADMARAGSDVVRLYLHRRRQMSDRRLAALGVDALSLGLDANFIPPEAALEINPDQSDVVAAVSRLESQFYMRNMLLRDSDTNGMAHSLEIRVPFLDKRMLELAYAIPGRVRLPEGKADKHLLRVAFAPLLRPALTGQAKRGFWLPIRRWMAGPLRERCEDAIAHVKSAAMLSEPEIDGIWGSFLGAPDSQVWSSAFLLCVLGVYLRQAETRAGVATEGQVRDLLFNGQTKRESGAPVAAPVR